MLGHIDCYGMSDLGKTREDNQDQFSIAELQKSMRVYHTSLDLDDETRVFGGSQGMSLVCTDGLTRYIHNHDIRHMLQQDKPVKELCEELIDAANRAGGFDNVTAIVAQCQVSEHAPEELLREAVDISSTQRSDPTQNVTQPDESEAPNGPH